MKTNITYGGLDLGQLDSVSDGEWTEFAEFYDSRFGHQHVGLAYMLRERPDALKAFRLYVRAAYDDPEADELPFSVVPGFFIYYAHVGYTTGARYLMQVLQKGGFSKDDCLDVLAIAGLVVGPAGFETIGRGLVDYAWVDQASSTPVPLQWDTSLETLRAGLDFTDTRLLPGEFELLEAWYTQWLGEVPAWLTFMAQHHPEVVKVQRLRFERCLRTLPKQTLPLATLHFRLMRGDTNTIRENLLMARGFGVTKAQALRTIAASIEYGGEESIAVVASASIREILDHWPEQAPA